MATKIVTDSMRAHVDVLLSRSHKWARGHDTRNGRAFVIFTSSRQGKDGRQVLYYAAPDGSACTCPSYYHRGACSHAEACRLEAEAAREAVGPKRATYRELYPSCQADGCDAEPEAHEQFCYRHAVVAAF